MAITVSSAPQTTVELIDLARIEVAGNVRELDPDHVQSLAGSIELRGQLVPVIVRPTAGDRFELVAGFHRHAAMTQLGLTEIRAEIQTASEIHVDRGVENVTRKQLSVYEEAQAVKAMLSDGLTQDGAAQALGWSKARVTARVRLLELPQAAQLMIGRGQIPVSGVEQLRAIGQVSPALLDALVAFIAGEGNEWAADQLTRDPTMLINHALRDGKVFAAFLTHVNHFELAELKLGKKTDALYDQAEQLAKKLDRYAYGHPSIRFADTEIDQARAAGVVIELRSPLIVDRKLYRELCKQAIARTVTELKARIEQAETERREQRQASREQRATDDPVGEADRELNRRLREIAVDAHGANLDLARDLMDGLSVVDPSSLDIARFFVFGLLGPQPSSSWDKTGEMVHRIAMTGVRLTVEQFRSDVTKTRKDGTRGALKIDYGQPQEITEPVTWLFKYLEGAKTAGELYGRALVVILAEQHASRLVVAQSQRHTPIGWRSHNDRAIKALTKIAKGHLPASLAQIRKNVERAHRDADTARVAARQHTATTGTAEAAPIDDIELADDELSDDEQEVD